jgi:hypothetical protein
VDRHAPVVRRALEQVPNRQAVRVAERLRRLQPNTVPAGADGNAPFPRWRGKGRG